MRTFVTDRLADRLTDGRSWFHKDSQGSPNKRENETKGVKAKPRSAELPWRNHCSLRPHALNDYRARRRDGNGL